METKTAGIVRREGVSGGDGYIAGTRIPVWALVLYRRLGATDDELIQWYPTLRREDLKHAWTYYKAHREEIDKEIIEYESVLAGVSLGEDERGFVGPPLGG